MKINVKNEIHYSVLRKNTFFPVKQIRQSSKTNAFINVTFKSILSNNLELSSVIKIYKMISIDLNK